MSAWNPSSDVWGRDRKEYAVLLDCQSSCKFSETPCPLSQESMVNTYRAKNKCSSLASVNAHTKHTHIHIQHKHTDDTQTHTPGFKGKEGCK